MWIITPLLYFSNFWNAQRFDSPLAAHLYNSTFGVSHSINGDRNFTNVESPQTPFQRLDVLQILTPELTLNETRFADIQPILLTPYFALSYGVSFAVLTSAITTVALWHWEDIKKAFSSRDSTADIHVESKLLSLMSRTVPALKSLFGELTFISVSLQCLSEVTQESHRLTTGLF